MHGVTGRMGMNQHLIRSIVAIRKQGGVTLTNGDKVMPDPILIGLQRRNDRSASTAAHGITRWGTDLDEALKNKVDDTIFFDAGTIQCARPCRPRPSAPADTFHCENRSPPTSTKPSRSPAWPKSPA